MSLHKECTSYTEFEPQPHSCFHTLSGQGESEAGITVYEDVNTDATAKVSGSVLALYLLFKVHVVIQEDFRSFF